MRVWNEAKGFLDRVQTRGSDMNAEERAQWARYNTEIDDLDARVSALDDRERRESESATARMAFERHHGSTSDGGRYPSEAEEGDLIRRFLKGDPTAGEADPQNMGRRVLRVPISRARKEVELQRQGASMTEARALAWDTGSIASGVPTLMARSLYQYFEASTAMFRAPTTKVVTTSGSTMDFPRLSAHSIGTQISGQGTTIAGTDPTFAKVSFGAFKYGQLIEVASEVIQDTAFDIGEFLGRDIGRAIGRVVDTDLVLGSGTGEPHGLMVALAGGGAGSVTTGGSLIDPTYEKLVDLQYSVVDEYRMGGSAGWLMRDATAGVLRKLRDGSGGTLGAVMWEPSLTNGISGGEPDRLLDAPVFRDPNVASLASNARIMSYGDFSAYYIRTVGDLMIERDDSVFFDSDEVAIRGKLRCDGDLMDYNSMVTMVRNV